MMRPGSVIAAACLALLSSLRFADGAYLAAAVFAVLALAVLAMSLRPRRAAGPPPTRPPSTWEVQAAKAAHDAYRRGWRRIAVLGFVISAVGAFVFPPMALVVAGLSVYAVHRMRQSSESTRLLSKATS